MHFKISSTSNNWLLVALLFIIACSCSTGNKDKAEVALKSGFWKGDISSSGHKIPFIFEVNRTDSIYNIDLINADERIPLDGITIKNDSVHIPLHIFDADIIAKIDNDHLTGYWIKNYEEGYKVPFEATFGDSLRFTTQSKPSADFTGKWEVTFASSEQDTTLAIGVFKQHNQKATGTFLTKTGDYRYLEGVVEDSTIKLSTFDGNHAYLFEGTLDNNRITGSLWAGKSGHETWTAERNENYKLPDADSLTFLKPGYEQLSFTFPTLNGDSVSLTDYKGKPVIIQLFGSWCPNCMDETKFLSEWYDKNKNLGIEILGLAYEAKPDFEYAKNRVQKMIDRFNVGYSFAIAGVKDKAEASKTLPALNKIISFPTTIYIDSNGKILRIHTGFAGPGTGEYYTEFVDSFNETVSQMKASM